jgi:hypothetical protein
MGTVLYTPALVKQADELKDEAIIKQIIMDESNSNMSGSDIKKICVNLTGSQKLSCYDQLEGSEKTDYTEEQLASYWKAVGGGYKKSIADFIKKKDTLSKLLGYGTALGTALSGLATTSSNQGTNYGTTPEPKKLSRNAKIGITVGSVVVLGTIAYFILRRK